MVLAPVGSQTERRQRSARPVAEGWASICRLGWVCGILLGGCVAAIPPANSESLPAAASGPVGYLEGQVTIGPLRPSERVGEPPPLIPPAAYAARAIQVFAADGATLVTRVRITPDGTYRVALAPGTYVVDIAPTGRDRARGLPATVAIASGQTVRLDIDIDTGMR